MSAFESSILLPHTHPRDKCVGKMLNVFTLNCKNCTKQKLKLSLAMLRVKVFNHLVCGQLFMVIIQRFCDLHHKDVLISKTLVTRFPWRQQPANYLVSRWKLYLDVPFQCLSAATWSWWLVTPQLKSSLALMKLFIQHQTLSALCWRVKYWAH